MSAHQVPYDDWFLEFYSKRPGELAPLLQTFFAESRQDGDWSAFLRGVPLAAKVYGAEAEVPSTLNGVPVEEVFANPGSPALNDINALLRPLGLQFGVQLALAGSQVPAAAQA